ncbi:DUF1351 domain-containing protein [Marinobacter sp. MDS2]|uniref:DUF1351 domain-containing protein n=1 Tax=Marinobacter sp. MDS2 TaxID=3065961 RepID=UPI00273CC9D6|nr:DUF1351 domain-containing protein [Marinobacter sp. MDS2]MDP4546527.1 DUF1351 domain-containing protein [Marinobacter sp. MDS2]
MQELIAINNVPALVEVNFDELKATLSLELKKYEGILVTADTVKGAKKLATELNATKAAISKRRKEEVAKASAPVKAFDAQMKELETMVETGRQALLAQAKVFDDETRALAVELLQAHRAERWADKGVRPEFQRAECDHLALVTAVTGTGKLAAGARTKLDALVDEDKRLQDQTDMRLLKLENESYKAGLSAPLNRGHVEHFLFDEETAYAGKLAALMASELDREQVAQQRMREKMAREQEARQAEVVTKAPQESAATVVEQINSEDSEQYVASQGGETLEPSAPAASAPRDAGRVPVTVACTFALEVSASVTDEAIQAELRRVLEAAGITTLDTIAVHRQQEAA